MIINTCTVKFYLDQTTIKHDGYRIYCRLIVARKKAEFYTGFQCHYHDWDGKLNQPKPKCPDALIKLGEIGRIQSVVNNTLNDANREGRALSAKDIKEYITGNRTNHYTLLSLGEEVINHYEKNKKAPAHLEKIKNTMEYVRLFLEKEKKKNLLIQSVTLRTLKDFEDFLRTVKIGRHGTNLGINTVGKHMSRLRTVCKYATDSEIISKNIFNGYRIPQVKVRRPSLSLAEFRRLRDLDLSDSAEKDRVRDCFIFCCYTGIRYADSQQTIKFSDIKYKKDYQTFFICFTQSKNSHNVGIPIEVPLLPEAMKIVEKYKDTNFREIEDLILPPATNQHINRILKELAKDAEVDPSKNLSFHISRHTCAQLQYEAEIMERTTGAWLGHFSNSITSVYQNDYEKALAKAAIKYRAYLNGI